MEIILREREAAAQFRKLLEPIQERMNKELLEPLVLRVLDVAIEIEMHDLMA